MQIKVWGLGLVFGIGGHGSNPPSRQSVSVKLVLKMVLGIRAKLDVAHQADAEFIAKLETRNFQNSSTASLA